MSNGPELLTRPGARTSGAADDAVLREVLMDALLIDPSQYRDDAGPDQIGSWDSLAMVEVAAGVEERFGYAMLPEELIGIRAIGDIKTVLRNRGVAFAG